MLTAAAVQREVLRQALTDAIYYRDPPLYCTGCPSPDLLCDQCTAGHKRARAYLALSYELGLEVARRSASSNPHTWPVRHVRLPAPVLRVVGKCLRTWWKVRKPTTFGVKVLLIHPDDPAQCLIVRHSYSDSSRWGMPGDAYRAGRETPEQAGVREMREELALTVTEVPAVLDTASSRWLERALSARVRT